MLSPACQEAVGCAVQCSRGLLLTSEVACPVQAQHQSLHRCCWQHLQHDRSDALLAQHHCLAPVQQHQQHDYLEQLLVADLAASDHRQHCLQNIKNC